MKPHEEKILTKCMNIATWLDAEGPENSRFSELQQQLDKAHRNGIIAEAKQVVRECMEQDLITAYSAFVLRRAPYVIEFDGACQPTNPGGAMGFGYVITKSGQTVHEWSGYQRPHELNTNNVAEYRALYHALEYLLKRGWKTTPIEVFGDSQLVIKQMNREWQVKGGAYAEDAHATKRIAERFKKITYTWINRELNKRADALSTAELKNHGITITEFKRRAK